MIWELLDSRDPYPGMSNMEVIQAVCREGHRMKTPTRIPHPPLLDSLMQECWNVDIQKRPSFEKLGAELRNLSGLTASNVTPLNSSSNISSNAYIATPSGIPSSDSNQTMNSNAYNVTQTDQKKD